MGSYKLVTQNSTEAEKTKIIMDKLMNKIKSDFSPLFCDILFKALRKPIQEHASVENQETEIGELSCIQETSVGEPSPPPSPQDDPPSPDSLGEDVETIDLATSEDEVSDAHNAAFVTPKRRSRKMTPSAPKTPKRWNCHLCGKRGNRKQTGLKIHLKKVHGIQDLVITPKKTPLGSPVGLKRLPSLSLKGPKSPKVVWACHLCGKRCNRQMGLTIHLK